MIYQELTAYSPMTDGLMTRLSSCDERGSEYFCFIPRERAKKWRAAKEIALGKIEQAMARGEQPGEIKITLDA